MKIETLKNIVNNTKDDIKKIKQIIKEFEPKLDDVISDIRKEKIEISFKTVDIEDNYDEMPNFIYQVITQLAFDRGFNQSSLIFEDNRKEKFKIVLEYDENDENKNKENNYFLISNTTGIIRYSTAFKDKSY